MAMCYQLVERYSSCRCLYYQHAVDRCPGYGQPGHHITTRTVLVGYTCQNHALEEAPSHSTSGSDVQTSKPTTRASSKKTKVNPSRSAKSLATPNRKPAVPKSQRPAEPSPKTSTKSTGKTRSGGKYISKEDSDDDLSSVEAFLFDDTDKSSLTSNTTVESSTALEHLTDGFLYDGYLQDLWPQVVLRSSSSEEAKEQISLLILRYSLDLLNLARKQGAPKDSEDLKIRVSQFVKRKRRHLAQEIYKQFWLPLSAVSRPTGGNNAPEKDLGDESGSDDDQPPDVGRIISLKGFLFETEPFSCFRENIRRFVEESFSDPLRVTRVDSIRTFFNNFAVSLSRKSESPKTRSLYWTCKCGLRLYDDYTEYHTGALDDLENLLSKYGGQSRGPGDLESNNSKPATNSNNNNSPSAGRNSFFALDKRLPRYWLRKDYWEPGKCRQSSGMSSEQGHNYLLACLPFGRWVSKLYQQEICTILSDQDFFSLLRMLYHTNRRRLPLSWLRRVNGIHFVQFDVHRTEIASIRSKPALPPEDMKDQYQYDPMPAQLVPPIGPNMLVHFFENPTHASVLPDLYKRIPKKLRMKLTPCQVTGMSVGWGIQFVEGIDNFTFFICGCICFLACLIVSVSWAAAKQDIQGGFGIGGFLLAFMVFCGSIVHSALET